MCPPQPAAAGLWPPKLIEVLGYEQIMEHVAHAVGKDPADVRARNFLKKYPFPDPVVAPTPLHGCTPASGSGQAQGTRVPGGCGRLNGWRPESQTRLMRTSLGRSGCPVPGDAGPSARLQSARR